jgi:hypothetical protein
MGVNGAQCNRYKLHLAQFGHLIDLKEIARSGIRSIGNSKPPNQKKSAYSQTGERSNLGYGGKMKSLDKNLDDSLDDSLKNRLDGILDHSLDKSLDDSLDKSLDKSLDDSLDYKLRIIIAILSIAVTIAYFFFVVNYLKLFDQITCYSEAKCNQLK